MMSNGFLKSITMVMMMILMMSLMTPVSFAVPSYARKGARGCSKPKAPRRGTYQLSGDEMSVEFMCQPGHNLVGNRVAVCSKGLWSNQPPVCVGGNCEMPAIRDGSMVWRHGGGIVRIECRKGFQLRGGSEFLACIDGQWNSSKPECIKNQQRMNAKSLKQSYLVSKHQKPEDKEKQQTAKKSHQDWLEDSDYSCIHDVSIVSPPSVPNARAIMLWATIDGRPRLYTTYHCKWGFKSTAEGTKNVYCKNRQWIGSTPKCQTVVYEEPVQKDVLGSGPSLSHDELLLYADYSCSSNSGPQGIMDPPVSEKATPIIKFIILQGRPHLYAEYNCDEGYQWQNEKRSYLYCKRKRWIGDLSKCVPALSKLPCRVKNGGCDQLCNENSRGGAVCSCKKGFTLQPDKMTCTDVDECEVNSGDCDHSCQNSIGSFQCSCFPGYTLESDQKSCTRLPK